MRQEFKLVLILCGLTFIAGSAALVSHLVAGIPAAMPPMVAKALATGNVIAGLLYLLALVALVVGLRRPEALRVLVPIAGIGLLGNLLVISMITGPAFGLHAIAALLGLTALLSLPRHAGDPTL